MFKLSAKVKQQINSSFYKEVSSRYHTKRKYNCLYPNCSNLAVHSHSISKETSLRPISTDGNLLTIQPKRDDTKDLRDIEICSEGINNATTFKGFCSTHEKIFHSIDTRGISTLKDIFLQCYRSISKDNFTRNLLTQSELKSQKSNIVFNPNIESEKVINSSKLTESLIDLIENGKNLHQEIDIPPSATMVISLTEACQANYQLLYRKLDVAYPVAIEKRLTIRLLDKASDSYITVIPESHQTHIIVISHESQIDLFAAKLSSPIDTLCFVEWAMIHDAEFWIAPDVVKSWSEEKANHIVRDYQFFYEHSTLGEYDTSIFDDLRIKLCEDLSEDRKNKELKKINHLTKRKPLSLREAELEKVLNPFN